MERPDLAAIREEFGLPPVTGTYENLKQKYVDALLGYALSLEEALAEQVDLTEGLNSELSEITHRQKKSRK